MNFLAPIIHWGLEFKSDTMHGWLCLFILYLYCRGPATARSPVRRVLPTVHRFEELKSDQGTAKGYSYRTITTIIIIIIIIIQKLPL
jgi:hypothetical protein